MGLSPAIDSQRASDAYATAITIEDKRAGHQDGQAVLMARRVVGSCPFLAGSTQGGISALDNAVGRT